jgi:5-methyltetrahydropteroyltriglutamate--homocysteine methyltransferase
VRLQEDAGLQSVTDGEYRRTYFHIDFLEQLSRASRRRAASQRASTARRAPSISRPPVMRVTGPVRHEKPIQVDDFDFLKSVTRRMPKVTIPSPTMLHFRGGRKRSAGRRIPISTRSTPTSLPPTRRRSRRSVRRVCRYLQLDDTTNLAYLCDAKLRDAARHARRRSRSPSPSLREIDQCGHRRSGLPA